MNLAITSLGYLKPTQHPVYCTCWVSACAETAISGVFVDVGGFVGGAVGGAVGRGRVVAGRDVVVRVVGGRVGGKVRGRVCGGAAVVCGV